MKKKLLTLALATSFVAASGTAMAFSLTSTAKQKVQQQVALFIGPVIQNLADAENGVFTSGAPGAHATNASALYKLGNLVRTADAADLGQWTTTLETGDLRFQYIKPALATKTNRAQEIFSGSSILCQIGVKNNTDNEVHRYDLSTTATGATVAGNSPLMAKCHVVAGSGSTQLQGGLGVNASEVNILVDGVLDATGFGMGS